MNSFILNNKSYRIIRPKKTKCALNIIKTRIETQLNKQILNEIFFFLFYEDVYDI